jgi:integrase
MALWQCNPLPLNMTPADLAEMLELMAAALRAMPACGVAQAPQGAAPAAPQRTLAEWLDVHERQIRSKGLKPRTLCNRASNLKHVRRLWGARPLAELRPHEITAALRGPEFEGKRSTAGRVLAELREAYDEAIANDWADRNPASHVKLPAHRVERKRLSLETWQAMSALAQASSQPWLDCLLLLALVTGQRRGDLVKMRFDDVVDGHLRVEQQKQAGKGYGARVAIPLSLRLDAIGVTVGGVIELCKLCGAPGPTLLRKAGGGALEESSLSIRFAECIRAVCGEQAYKAHEWPSLHEVRSLSARLYKSQGIDTQTLLGHRHAEMTAVYEDDRGLTAHEYKRLRLTAGQD